MKHLDLFSGIGGFALAAERVGWQTVAFCETDEFCRRVIERRFDRVRWISLSGLECGRERLGLRGDSELSGIDPDWLVIENVGHTWRKWVPELRRKLFDREYASLPFRVRASDLGAPHQRSRIFVVANADCEQLRKLSRWWQRESRQVAYELGLNGAEWALADPDCQQMARVAKSRSQLGQWAAEPSMGRVAYGVPDRAHRLKALGNAVVPQCAELLFRGIEAVSKEYTQEHSHES